MSAVQNGNGIDVVEIVDVPGEGTPVGIVHWVRVVSARLARCKRQELT